MTKTGQAHAPESMSHRIARYADLEPITVQQDVTIPQAALDVIFARRLLSVIGRDDGKATAISTAAPIQGAGGITITLAVCPPGQGPGLHSHEATFETFTVMEGEFEVSWGADGEHLERLQKFDTFSVPPGTYRAFRNVSQAEGVLQVLISGGVHDASDIAYSQRLGDDLRAASVKLYDQIEKSGVKIPQGA